MKLIPYFGIILATLIFLSYEKTGAQSPDWLWAKAMGGTSFDRPNSITFDSTGNVYTTGAFWTTVDFDPGTGTFNLVGAGFEDIFISKLDNSGNFVWAKRIGGISHDIGKSIKLDASGNIYTIGEFKGTVDFDPGPSNFNLTSAGGNSDVFISKLDASGNFIWVKQIAGTSDDIAQGLVIDPNGNLYIVGYFRGTADFDPGTGVFNLTASAGHDDAFIVKLDNTGNFAWAKAMDGVGNAYGNSVAIDASGNVYSTGYIEGTIDFNPDPLDTFNITSSGFNDLFISKLNNSGNFIWAKTIGGITGAGRGFSLSIDPLGNENIYTTGRFDGTIDFDPDSTGNFSLTSSGTNHEMFISKLDTSGNFVWAKHIGGTMPSDACEAFNLVLDTLGNIFTTGWFSGIVDFDPGLGNFNLTSTGGTDIFISKLDESGNFVWAKQIGGTTLDYGQSLTLNNAGNVYITGNFESPSILFGTTTLINADITGFTPDIFIAKLDTLLVTGNSEIANFGNYISIFPNPANNHLTIDLGSRGKKITVTITDIIGKIIYITSASETQKIEVNTKDFAEGIYVVQIQTAGFIGTKKLVVKK